MHLTHITCLLLLMLASHPALADDDSSTETNEIIPREAIQKLDFSVRQALLRAIDKLEKEADDEDAGNDEFQENDENNEEAASIAPSTITIQSTTALPINTQSKDEILEESTSSSDIFPSVQFFTATYDENNAHEQTLAAFIDKSKSSTKKVNKNFGSPVVVTTNVKEDTQTNHQAARSVINSNHNNNNVQSNEISLNGLDEIKFEIRNSKISHKPQTTVTTEEYTTTTTTTTTTHRPITTKKRKPTTTTTTTTTTPRPTHNEDGENIEIVAKDDIRIQAAPLVSAFTVDLDEQGGAKSVVPIIHRPLSTAASSSTQRTASLFQPPIFSPTITKLNVSPTDAQRSAALRSSNNLPPTPTQPTYTSSTSQNIFANIVPTSGHYITKQPLTANFNQQQQQSQQDSNVNNYFFEKQHELEQQIYQLKLQAQQQQELILRQLKLLEEQSKLRNTQATSANAQTEQSPNTIIQSLTQLSQQHQPQQRPQQLPLVQQEPGFTIRPSIEFIPSTQTKSAPNFQAYSLEQQLPLKESNGKFIKGNGFSNNHIQTQQLPTVNNPIQQVFQNLQNLQNNKNSQPAASISSIQIQPSNQLSITPTFVSTLQQTPAELSHVQALPQRNYQQFQQNPLVPQYVTSALLERQQQQQQQQQHQARYFRQEGDTGNFGVNQLQIQPSNNLFSSYLEQQQQKQQQQQPQQSNNFDNQNFYRQHLIPEFSNQLKQNAQQYYQQQQQQPQQQQQSQSQQQNSPTGNYYQQRFHNTRLNSLEEFNIITKVLALNHGINNFAQQQSSAPTISTQSQSARFNSNIF